MGTCPQQTDCVSGLIKLFMSNIKGIGCPLLCKLAWILITLTEYCGHTGFSIADAAGHHWSLVYAVYNGLRFNCRCSGSLEGFIIVALKPLANKMIINLDYP